MSTEDFETELLNFLFDEREAWEELRRMPGADSEIRQYCNSQIDRLSSRIGEGAHA